MASLMWSLAATLVVSGVFSLTKGQMLWGIVLIAIGAMVGPGGVSVFP